jgi:hypothetical protein
MRKLFLAFALFAMCAAAFGQPARGKAGPMQPDPLSLEKWFVGTWICKGTQYGSPTASGVKFTDRFVFKMTLRDSWLNFHIDQLKGPVKGKQTLIGFSTWDDNAKMHIRRDMNIGGSRLELTSPGWDGDKLVFTGSMILGDQKLPVKHSLTKKGDAAYDAYLEMFGADGKPAMWEEESCKKVRGARTSTPIP